MNLLPLHEFHQTIGAVFGEVNGAEAVLHYGDWRREHAALRESAAVIDLSFRSRLCLVGADRAKFLHGQVTHDVNALAAGQGCYAALVNAKGRMQSDLQIWNLADELLLDFEPGLAGEVAARLEKYIVSDDVQLADAAPHYGLISVQGAKAGEILTRLCLGVELPAQPLRFVGVNDATLGQLYLMNQPRMGVAGFDLFAPAASLGVVADKLIAAAKPLGGRAAGWQALETARIEAGIPRYGADMDETTLPPEAGLEARMMSYRKGCYIGQEVLNRLHTMGHVNRELRGLQLAGDLHELPMRGDKLFKEGKETGRVTSAAFSPALSANVALGYVRREWLAVGTELLLETKNGSSSAWVAELPFVKGQA